MVITWDPALYDARHQFVWQAGGSLVELLAPQPGERIIDLGCGTGHLTAAIAATGADVVGVDSSEEMLSRARTEHPGIRFHQADAREFDVGEGFDAVFSNAVLHWVRPPEAAIARVTRAMKPGGRFVAEFGGKGNIAAILAAVTEATREMGLPVPLPAWYFPSVGEYAALLEAAGLEVRFAHLFARPTPLKGDHGLRGWLKMFAPDAAANAELVERVERIARPTLWGQTGWVADYVRLRVEAVGTAQSRPTVSAYGR